MTSTEPGAGDDGGVDWVQTLKPGEEPQDARRYPVLIVVGSAAGLDGDRALIRMRGPMEIGRGAAALPIEKWSIRDGLVSRRHARVVPLENRFEIRDLDSTNGTFVLGGSRWEDTISADSGSLLMVGDHAAVLAYVTQEALEAIEEDTRSPLAPVPTMSPSLAVVARKLRRLAARPIDLLLCGATGVGKEVYARAVHEASGRKGPFLALSCAALPEALLESELFGHKKGSFSGADSDREGLVAAAAGGTLFLDEIGEMSPRSQAKMLRFLQERTYFPLGGRTLAQVDLRVIAATNNHPASRDGGIGGGLRSDLVERLGPDAITIPDLASRREDLIALCAHFLRDAPGLRLTGAALRALCQYSWPGNVRELEKNLEAAKALVENDGCIDLRHLSDRVIESLRNASRIDFFYTRQASRSYRPAWAWSLRTTPERPAGAWRR